MNAYKAIDLPYNFDALEPFIDSETVKIHYTSHHKGYETKLNNALNNTKISETYPTLESLVKNYLKIENIEIKTAIREFGGGLINHNFFWPSLSKNYPLYDGPLKIAIIKIWGTLEKFFLELEKNCLSLFGSGWVWLVKKKEELKIIKTFNQDNPWFLGYTPIIGIDLWEHSYYLKYKSNRKEYFENIIKLINWEFCEKQYLS